MLKQISDNVHGAIVIEDKIIEQLIATREFRRLMNIEQLGLAHFVYPSATHSRYAHSLGVYELARRFMQRLNIKDDHKKLVVKVAALLHDIGHGPLSHLFEAVSVVNHEEYTVKLMTEEGTEVNKILSKNQSLLKEAVQVIQKKHSVKWMNTILSSQIDIDRLDYLKRDSLNTGTKYGLIDDNWLFRTAMIKNNELVYTPKSLSTIEQFIVGRYHMYQTVYHNVKGIVWQELYSMFFRRVFQLVKEGKWEMENKALEALAAGKEMTSQEFLMLDDHLFHTMIRKGSTSKDKILKKIGKTFITGKLPKYEVLNTVKSQNEFKSNLNKDEEGTTWGIINVKKDIKRYGSKQNEEAMIMDGNVKKRISTYSKLIKRALTDQVEIEDLVIGVKI